MSLKRCLALAAVPLLLFSASYFLPIRGAWLDRLATRLLSHNSPFAVSCSGTVVRHWTGISFARCEVLSEGLLKKPLTLEDISARLFPGPSGGLLRIFRARSRDMRLKGGVVFSGGQILKLHLLVFVSGEILGKVPADWQRRLLYAPNGWRAARIVWNGRTLTLRGAQGPILQFETVREKH